MVGHDAAVRNSVEHLSPVIAQVKADRTPEISGPPQEQAQKEPKQHHRLGAGGILMRIEQVAQAEQAGHHERRWPKADSGSECVLDVPAKQEFFNQCGQQKCDAQTENRGQDRCPMNRQPGNTEPVQKKYRQQRTADRQKARERPNPEILSQRQPQGQTILAEFAMLNFAHHQRSDAEKQQGDCFRTAQQKWRDRNLTLILVPVVLPEGFRPACSYENKASK